MQDDNIFFYLTAADGRNKASSAIRLPQNSSWFNEAQGGVEAQPTISSREPTPAPDIAPDELQQDPSLGLTERLVVTFSELRRWHEHEIPLSKPMDAGVAFGTDPRSCHIVLGFRGTPGISAKQFAVGVDHQLRPVLTDLGSAYGTAVETNGQNKNQKRIRHQWVLARAPGKSDLFQDIIIWLGELALKIVFPNHSSSKLDYLQNLNAFANTCGLRSGHSSGNALTLGLLELESQATTQAPSGAQTPTEAPVYFRDKQIGQGAFGKVHRVINMADGMFYAAKTFVRPRNKRPHGSADPSWLTSIRREFTIVDENPHPNVVRVVAFQDVPEPVIYMVYFESGNMANAKIPDDVLYISAFGQILSGLEHLHGKGIAHRDLKPENFLVEWTPFFKVAISDFGLAKIVPDSAFLSTFCGSLTYAAPEVFPNSAGHNHLVDIWSLGVIVLQWIYKLPDPPRLPKGLPFHSIDIAFWYTWTDKWSHLLRATLDDQEDCLLLDMLYGMLEGRRDRRWNASHCLQEGFKGKLFKTRHADQLVVCADDYVTNEEARTSEGATTPKALSNLSRADKAELTIIAKVHH